MMLLRVRQAGFNLLLIVCCMWVMATHTSANTDSDAAHIEQIDKQLAALARDQIRAGHHQRFLNQQRESALTTTSRSFIFDYPSRDLNSTIKHMFWNEPEGLFALIDGGQQQDILPGYLMHFYKQDNNQTLEPGGSMVVIHAFENESYVLFLQANLVPAVNDPVK